MLRDGALENGVYLVGVLPYGFEGPMTATYDRATSSFTNATWSVVEPEHGSPFGGSGTWSAQWAP